MVKKLGCWMCGGGEAKYRIHRPFPSDVRSVIGGYGFCEKHYSAVERLIRDFGGKMVLVEKIVND